MMLIGKTLGKYRITEHLGSGGMSEVYKAYQPGLDRYVAIKVLHSFLAQEEDFLTRFKREAKFAAMLRHPNIVQVYDFDHDEEDDVYYMVMEFIDGPSLKVRLLKMAEEGQELPLEEAIRIVAAIANGLDYAHQHGTVHRDVKPANIMFNPDEQPILTDFGIAKMVDVVGLTASGAMIGTPAYMAPEQGMGQAGDERSDIYSLGIVLHQLATGRLPFDADTPLGVALKHISAPLAPPTTINPNLPPGIEAVIMRALTKDPDKRYQTAKDFSTELKQAAAGQAVEPPPLESTLPQVAGGVRPQDQAKYWEMATLPSAPAIRPPASPKKRKRRWIPVLIAVLALIVVGVAALFATGGAGRLLASIISQAATPTPTIVGTPTVTPDTIATQHAIAGAVLATRDAQATLEATLNATATPTPTPTPTATPDLTATAAAGCVFDIKVVSDPAVWPRVLIPGQQFVKRWEIENTGTCAWPETVQLVFVSGDELEIIEEPEVEPLAPEETTEIEITLRAPAGYDAYSSVWQLQDDEGNPIGEELEIACRVGPTPTPRPTATVTPTPTPEFTPTPVRPLEMSVPILTSCWADPDKGLWGGSVGWSAWGGPSSEYHY
ncbi:MAG: protein kinase, partial [Chloroflexi bacterium]|nr:protein kinase [Chloroflexota bacterium]